MIQGKYQNEKEKPSFDIKVIDNICDTFITQKLRKNKSKVER